MTGATAQSIPAAALPQLRQDLQLLEAEPEPSGAPRWRIYDPLQHRYVSIGRTAYVLFNIWNDGLGAEALIARAWTNYGELIDAAEIDRFSRFLHASSLCVEPPDGKWTHFVAQSESRRRSLLSRILHNYIFFRIPLIKPQPLLVHTLPFVRPLGSTAATVIVIVLGLAGLYLVSREWTAFLASAAAAMSTAGAVQLALAVAAIKVLHELGHAYVATHLGCRVPVIGVAFILGFPLLYSDVTDAWRLKSRRQRLHIDLAGVRVDLSVACVATFAWAFMEPGGLRDAAFYLATAGWISSLLVNLNPFMKFDGYYILGDWIGIENLQSRSFELGRWRLREFLFGLGQAAPEDWPPSTRRLLVLYAWAVWIYRVFLFTAIALAVYHLFFKLAGVVLFAVEIAYFILAPCVREIGEWWRMKQRILSSRRTWVSLSVLTAALVAFLLPWSSSVIVPAVMEAQTLARIHPVVPARVDRIAVRRGALVARNDVLATLSAPHQDHELAATRLRIQLIELRLARQAGDAEDRRDSGVLRDELASLRRREVGLQQQQQDLVLRSPQSGRLSDIMPSLHVGRWVGRATPLFLIHGAEASEAHGYLSEPDLWRIDIGAKGIFVPDDIQLAPIPISIVDIAQAASPAIERTELSRSHGGRIADAMGTDNRPVPIIAQYRVRATTAADARPAYPARSVTGIIRVTGRPESLAARAWRRILKVLVRESGI